MSIRFSDEEMSLLRRAAEKERLSVGDVVRLAIRDRLERGHHHEHVRALAARVSDEDGDILSELGKR